MGVRFWDQSVAIEQEDFATALVLQYRVLPRRARVFQNHIARVGLAPEYVEALFAQLDGRELRAVAQHLEHKGVLLRE